eukprot:TRINITY_DN14166_c0_g1_i1.p1 TRINITY_DN14166_c0_g1~~TRINITY_DN14166_c0_g1_i1.p1  ORF type:complete len:213 (+),score=67.93 TRINITY_DN14166_c0_g1_i1:85-723(+)
MPSRHSAAALCVAAIVASQLLFSSAEAKIDFESYKTCTDCVDAGYGWCPIQRMCGGFANTQCGEGERYWRKDHTPDGEGKKKKGGKKGGKKKKAKKAKAEPGTPVLLTAANMTKTLDESDRFWVIKFAESAEPGDEWKTVGKVLRGVARVAHVDLSSDESAALKAEHSSGIKCFFKDEARSPQTFSGDALSVSGVVEWTYNLMLSTVAARTS